MKNLLRSSRAGMIGDLTLPRSQPCAGMTKTVMLRNKKFLYEAPCLENETTHVERKEDLSPVILFQLRLIVITVFPHGQNYKQSFGMWPFRVAGGRWYSSHHAPLISACTCARRGLRHRCIRHSSKPERSTEVDAT